ncbi:SNF2 domain-containing protein CLASSY 4-like [Actinidia eriantha]|uniref:SNF2 domain-containing protein CLASSY 4-like n=1 Tax=Actinidia eriantha TaxID=165200 RepID=UPI00258AA521|nr:SNF2 domain-containing protein CLASSY 4-like [Actinidia eriantha]
MARVDSNKKRELVKKLKRKRNAIRIGTDEDEAENVVKGRVDLKKNRGFGERLKKNRNVIRIGVADDDEIEDEVENVVKGRVDLTKNKKIGKMLKEKRNALEVGVDDYLKKIGKIEKGMVKNWDGVIARFDSKKKNRELGKKLKENRNVSQIGADDDDETEDEVENVVKGRVDLKKDRDFGERLKKNRNVIRIGVVDDDEIEDEVENVKGRVYLKKSHGLVERLKKDRNVIRIGGVDGYEIENVVKGRMKSKKIGKRLKEKRNAVEVGVDDDYSEDEIEFLGMRDKNGRNLEDDEVGVGDDYSEDEIEFLGMRDKNGKILGADKVVEEGIVDSNSCLGEYSRPEEVRDAKNYQKRKKTASVKMNVSGVPKKVKEVIYDVSTNSKDSDESNESEDDSESKDSSDSGDSEESESSSAEDSDDSSDVDYELDVNSYEDDEEDADEDESGVVGSKRGRSKLCKVASLGQSSSFSGLKRKKFCGMDRLIGEKEDGKNECESVAERLRLWQRCVSKSTTSRKKQQEFGTSSGPFTLTDKELEFSSGDEDETDGDDNNCFNNGSDGENVQNVGDKGKGKLVTPAKRSRKGVYSAPRISVDKILADSIWEKGDVYLENLYASRDRARDEEPTLLLKFRFEDDDPKPPEKSYWDIEADKLFAERDFALAACQIGSTDFSMVDNEKSEALDTETDPASCCRQGKHWLVLDEQIGLRCTFCSFVALEIKHLLPSFSKHPWGRPYWKDLVSIDPSNLDELQFQDSASVHQSGSKCYNHAEGTVWDIIPGIKDSMYPHQREGFEFIWKNIAGSIELEELKKHSFDGGSGCIISHAPGTGKTRLTIVFLHTYMELNRTCKPVIIAPRSMLLTWEEEFWKWKVGIPFHNLNQLEFSGQENAAAINLLRQKVGRRGKNKNSIRMVKLYSWAKDRSILGISYTLFEKLAGDGVLADGGSEKNRKVKSYAQGEQVRKMLLELPGLLVLDEGHTSRNDQSLIWKALSRVETQRRIILSGTPFQNNFGELFNTLCVVRPKFGDRFLSGTRGDSRRKQGTKSSAARGTWASLTSSIGKDCDGRLDELKAMIEPFVHVHKGTILKESLPGLRDSVVVLRPTCLQKALIEVIRGRKSQLELDYLMSLISVHPSLLLSCCLSEKEELSVDKRLLETLKCNPEAGIKTKFLMELIWLSGALKEKVLIFSQYIDPLTLIKEQLKSHFKWTEGNEVLYMDGTLDSKHRQSSISSLNDPASEVRVLLASTKACSEGINLVGASRVVLLDVVWNPSVERQAISRAYRLGQKKVVYIYHLITSGTIEGEKYLRQAEKDRLSELVFSSADGGVPKPESSCPVGEDMILREMVQHEKMSNMFEKILNQPKESDLIVTFG